MIGVTKLLSRMPDDADFLRRLVAGLRTPRSSTIMLGGYQQDCPLVLIADPQCHIVGRTTGGGGQLLLRHDCTGTRGGSGARFGKWCIAGVAVAAEGSAAGGLAVVLDEARKRL